MAISSLFQNQIRAEHGRGLGNREIARAVGCHWRTVAYQLAKLGLTTNKPRGKPPVSVNETDAICSHCNQVVPKTDFALVRSYDDGRRLSKCRSCRRAQMRDNLLNSLEAFCRDRQNRLRLRTARSGLEYSLPDGYILQLYRSQGGLCFYTDQPMLIQVGGGQLPNAMSVDRVDQTRGYTPENTVLCLNRANTIKSSMTLDEMREWMPCWYARVAARKRAF
jgi:hypothetical protein